MRSTAVSFNERKQIRNGSNARAVRERRQMWQPSEHSDEENLRWSWLRAVEWRGWPGFLAQPVVPILLLWWTPWKVCLGAVAANVLWSLVRYRFVSTRLSYLAALIVMLKIPVAVGMGIYFLCVSQWWKAGFCAAWVPFSAVASAFPGKIGTIQQMLMARLGYDRVGLEDVCAKNGGDRDGADSTTPRGVVPESWLSERISVEQAAALFGRANALKQKWEALKAQMVQGDELWRYSSPPETWRALIGRSGIALVRNGVPFAEILMLMN